MAQLISRAVHVILHVGRNQDGKRRISSIVEVVGQNGSDVEVQEVFAWAHPGTEGGGETGAFVRCSSSLFLQRFRSMGLLPPKRT
jgi:pilus assembly protein CpaF